MAHAIGTGGEKVEPNLIPLLDLILQLIMFFIVGMSFVSQPLKEIMLPELEHGQEIAPKTETEFLVINIEVGRELVPGPDGKKVAQLKTPKVTRISIHESNVRSNERTIEFEDKDRVGPNELDRKAALERAADVIDKITITHKRREARRLTREKGTPHDEKDVKQLAIPVVIRGDGETDYGLVLDLIAICTKAGLTTFEPRGLLSRRQ